MRRSHFFHRGARTALCAALLGAACAYGQADVMGQAQELMRSGKAADAYQLLESREVENAGNVDYDLMLGKAANAAGEYTRAIMALERVLAAQPGNRDARAEMGRALAAVGDNQGAKRLLQESRDQGIDVISGASVDQLLHAIERVEVESVSSARAYVEASVGYDSNINGAPGVSEVAVPSLGGSILAIAPGGTRKSGGFVGLGAGASGRMVLDPRWSLIGTVTGRVQKFGSGNKDQDNGSLDGSGGISYHTDRDEYTLALQAGTYEIDGDRARDTLGLVGEWTHRFDAFSQVNLYVQTVRLTYPQQRIADADREVIGGTYAMQAGSIWAYGGAYAGREKTRDDSVPWLGHHLWGVRAGVQFPVMDQVTGLVAGGYENRDYGGVDPLFLVTRHDRQTNLSAGLSWTVAPAWRVVPQWSWTRTTSSMPLAAYHKNAVSVAVRREY